jgi:hypothetical protein
VIVDLAGDQARFVDGALNGAIVIRAPLIPESHSDQSGEWNDSGDDQPDQSRSNAAKQHH